MRWVTAYLVVTEANYSNLCDLCDSPKTCAYASHETGSHRAALSCLAHRGGDVAYVALRYVRQFFGVSIIYKYKKFKFSMKIILSVKKHLSQETRSQHKGGSYLVSACRQSHLQTELFILYERTKCISDTLNAKIDYRSLFETHIRYDLIVWGGTTACREYYKRGL